MINQTKKILSATFIIIITFLLFAQLSFAAPSYEGNVKPYAVSLIDAKSGTVLYAKNVDDTIVPASTTKIMTCILGLEYGDLSSSVLVSKAASRVKGSSLNIIEGEQIVLDDLLIGLMLCSGNDAATAIAEHVGGSVEAFVDMMNAKADEIGMSHTHYVNPHGLPLKKDGEEINNETTVSDMSKLTLYAMKNPKFMQIVGKDRYEMPKTNKRKSGRTIKNTNRLIKSEFKEYYKYATGMKTGVTNAAGNCLVATAQKEGMQLACLIYKDDSKGGMGRWSVAKGLFEFGFDNFVTVELKPLLKNVKPVTAIIENHSQNDISEGMIEFNKPATECITIAKTLYNDLQSGADSIETECEYIEPMHAPIKKGDPLGFVKYMSEKTKEVIYEGNLIAPRDVLEYGAVDEFDNEGPIITMTPKPPEEVVPSRDTGLIWIWAIIPGGLIAFVVIRLLTYKRNKRRRPAKRRKPQYSYRIRR